MEKFPPNHILNAKHGKALHFQKTEKRNALAKGEIMDYKEMVRGAVLNAGPARGLDYQSRWACVAQILGVGSTTATELCKKFGKDPDEILS